LPLDDDDDGDDDDRLPDELDGLGDDARDGAACDGAE
jgi:hypothetical protein